MLFVSVAIRTSWFQTWLAQEASAYLSSELGTEVSIDKVEITFFDEVDLKGVYLEDVRKDTFLYTDNIHANIADWSISESFVNVSNLSLQGGHCHIRTYAGDSTMNFQHIVDYFTSDEPDTSSSNFRINLQQLELKDLHFVLHDENSSPLEHGLDFAHIDLNHFSGQFSDFWMDQGKIGINIDNLAFQDHSGLKLSKLSSEISFDSTLLSLKNFRLGLSNSHLSANELRLETPNGSVDWSDFMNKVKFSADFNPSTLHLSDLAYFVPDIWGFDGVITINSLDVSGPIYGMRLKNVDLSLLDTTRIKGDFKIPNLDDFNSAIFEEDIALFRTSISDIRKMNLAAMLDEKGAKDLEKNLLQFQKANVVKLENGSFRGGIESFVVDGDLYSGLGNIHSDYGIQFEFHEADGLYHYRGAQDESLGKHIIVENLDLGTITANSTLGSISGYLRINGKGFDEKNLDLKFNGLLSSFGIYDYDYKNIQVKQGHFAKNRFTGVVDIEDDNLALVYDGFVDLNKDMYFNFSIEIDSAHISKLAKKQKEFYEQIISKIKVDIHGTDINKLYGSLSIEDLSYTDRDIEFGMDKLTLSISRSEIADSIVLRSPYIDLDLYGKYDLADVGHAVVQQFSYVIDNIIDIERKDRTRDEFYSLKVDLKDVNSIIQFFDPDIYIAGGSIIRSEFNNREKSFAFDFNSELVEYHGTEIEEIKVENHFDSTKASIFYQSDYVKLNDSIEVKNVYLDSYVKDNKFLTNLGWDGIGKLHPALFAFESEITKSFQVLTTFKPSFFFLKDHKYDITKDSRFLWSLDQMVFDDFKISHKENYIGLDGQVSKNPNDWLNITVFNFDLNDLNGLIDGMPNLQGLLNIQGKVSDIYNNLNFQAHSEIDEFYVDNNLVGDLFLDSRWIERSSSIELGGTLNRADIKTFEFKGQYFTKLEKDNLSLDVTFANTDISFLNAFEDPDLYTDISGFLDGKLHVSGELANPIVTGGLSLVKTRVKVPMFNVYFEASGKLSMNDGEIIANHIQLKDQEGNLADCQMQIYHYDWSDWNYNITLDMDNPTKTKQFLALNTDYKEGDYYYGKAYVTGFVSVFGYDNHTEINVDVKTKPGTDLTLPMYGDSDIEENSFVIFDENFFLPDSLKNKDNQMDHQEVSRLGMTLNMKFNVTPSASVKIVFDPLTGDQIIAHGDADLEINMDDFGDLTMLGKYEINNGKYEMRMKGLVEEDFSLVKGGTVEWTGSPYDALINLKAEFYRNVSLNDIMPPEAGTSKKKDDVVGTLVMTNTLMAPELGFKISSPTKNDLAIKALAEIQNNQDELNKQFFALLVLKRFIPIYGGAAGGENVVLGIAETQINSILGGMSEKYQLEAGLSDGQTTLGLNTQVGDRTTISTSFGVLSDEDGGSSGGGNLVGDVDIEYRLNKDGSFTMNFFNETNEASITAQGHFTQGVSLHYQETFNTTREFRAWQKFLNIFRKRANRVKFEKENRKSDKWRPIPEEEE